MRTILIEAICGLLACLLMGAGLTACGSTKVAEGVKYDSTCDSWRNSPFGASTSLAIDIEEADTVHLTIYNCEGHLVRSASWYQTQGSATYSWDGADDDGLLQADGIYFYKVFVNGQSEVKKMIMINGRDANASSE